MEHPYHVVNCTHARKPSMHVYECLLGRPLWTCNGGCPHRVPVDESVGFRLQQFGDVPQPAAVKPLPRSEWPILARVVAKLAADGECGVGDTIATQLGKGGEWFKTAFHTLTGKSCGCSDRQAWCNARFPYG